VALLFFVLDVLLWLVLLSLDCQFLLFLNLSFMASVRFYILLLWGFDSLLTACGGKVDVGFAVTRDVVLLMSGLHSCLDKTEYCIVLFYSLGLVALTPFPSVSKGECMLAWLWWDGEVVGSAVLARQRQDSLR